MPSEITMPQLSDTMTEGTVVKWHKKEGDKVKAGEEIADVETDKATMPMESFDAGTVAYVAAKEGQKVKVGDLLAVIAKQGEDLEEIRKQAGSAGKRNGGESARPEPAAGEEGGGDVETDHPAQEKGRQAARREQVSEERPPAGASQRQRQRAEAGRQRVSPVAKRIASENGVDLEQVQGSGPGGRIVQRDVLAYVEQGGDRPSAKGEEAGKPAEAPARQVIPSGEKKVVQLTKMRTAIATALQRSKQTVPHFYETVDIDLEEVSKMRERLNQRLEKEDIRLSIADFIYKAVAVALQRHPALNARFNAEKGEVTQYGDVNLGIAVAIPDGLIVPVLRGVDQMSLREIRQRSTDLADRARGQRLKREEQSEATFTISSLGSYGIREFSAIINPPEVGILAVGAAEKRPVVRDDKLVVGTLMSVTLSADHRVVDGATAAEFLRTLRELLEEPGMLLV